MGRDPASAGARERRLRSGQCPNEWRRLAPDRGAPVVSLSAMAAATPAATTRVSRLRVVRPRPATRINGSKDRPQRRTIEVAPRDHFTGWTPGLREESPPSSSVSGCFPQRRIRKRASSSRCPDPQPITPWLQLTLFGLAPSP